MTAPKTVAIIGLGMIGGSVARALHAAGVRIVGYDSDKAHLDAAIAEGVVSHRLSVGLEEIRGADAVVIAVHGDAALDILTTVARNATGVQLVTDVGSTKQTIVAAATAMRLGERFVGSHPLAGDHRSGWEASRGDLFVNETVYLCPGKEAGRGALDCAIALWSSVGATTLIMDAAAHDELLAWTSHLPHLVSAALALALSQADVGREQLGRGGRDVTRLAGASPDVWTAVAIDNARNLDFAVAGMERELGAFRMALRKNDRQSLRSKFAGARQWSDRRKG